jgi:hypothetical protein
LKQRPQWSLPVMATTVVKKKDTVMLRRKNRDDIFHSQDHVTVQPATLFMDDMFEFNNKR